MHRIRLLTVALSLAVSSLACGLSSGEQAFSVSGWKAATKDERRRMAKDFLRKYDTKGWDLAQIKELLGEPEYEYDTWRYNLSLKGASPPGPQTMKVFSEYPQLYVNFREGRVDGLSLTPDIQQSDELKFDIKIWKASKPQERLKMATSLVESEILKGRTKAEAQQQLGPPDNQSEKREVEYDLGIRMIDVVTLTFTIGSDGRISDAQIIEH